MKKVLSMVLFLAAAGVGFTLLPSCGGGKGENTKDVITLNNMAANSNKYFRFVNGLDYMEVVPLGGGTKTENEDGTGSVQAAPCLFSFSSPAVSSSQQLVNYEVTEALNGVPTKARMTFLGFTVNIQQDPAFLSFFGIQKQYPSNVTVTNLEFIRGTLQFEIDFQNETAEMVYHTDGVSISTDEGGDIVVSDEGEEKRFGITSVVLHR